MDRYLSFLKLVFLSHFTRIEAVLALFAVAATVESIAFLCSRLTEAEFLWLRILQWGAGLAIVTVTIVRALRAARQIRADRRSG